MTNKLKTAINLRNRTGHFLQTTEMQAASALLAEALLSSSDYSVTPTQALAVHALQIAERNLIVDIVAKHWQTNDGYADFETFLELTADEIEDPYFLEDFQDAIFQLWTRKR